MMTRHAMGRSPTEAIPVVTCLAYDLSLRKCCGTGGSFDCGGRRRCCWEVSTARHPLAGLYYQGALDGTCMYFNNK